MGTSRPGRVASLVGPEKILRSLQRDVEVLSRERAKGDEAYSIAMLLSEYGARLDAPPTQVSQLIWMRNPFAPHARDLISKR